MKKIFIVLMAFGAFTSNAQVETPSFGGGSSGGLFFEYNIGTRIGGAVSDLSTMGVGIHTDGSIGYMFNNIIGIEGTMGFNTFKTVDAVQTTIEDKSWMLTNSIQAVLSISELAKMDVPTFGLNFHAGFGWATQSNPSWKESKLAVDGFAFNDPMIKGNDDMGLIIFGLTPRYVINSHFSINADFSMNLLLKQDWTVDRFNNVAASGTPSIMTASFGATYSL